MKTLNEVIVRKALKQSLTVNSSRKLDLKHKSEGEDKLISLLIHDVFGGEILKTQTKKYWHFYNRIDGERVDFSGKTSQESFYNNIFEDIPATTDDTFNYVDPADYSTFFMRFVRVFEEAIGLEKYQSDYSI
jgi:hypothetical protein